MTDSSPTSKRSEQNQVKVVDLGETLYEPIYARMQEFTRLRTVDSADEIWLTEHKPVFTQGLSLIHI